jgi:hypothetical protein
MTVIRASEAFIHRQIEQAYRLAEQYRDAGDPDSAAVFEDWAERREIELLRDTPRVSRLTADHR